jgi:hypothetical protein
MADHRATWVRLREVARQRFPDDDLAAEIAGYPAHRALNMLGTPNLYNHIVTQERINGLP